MSIYNDFGETKPLKNKNVLHKITLKKTVRPRIVNRDIKVTVLLNFKLKKWSFNLKPTFEQNTISIKLEKDTSPVEVCIEF